MRAKNSTAHAHAHTPQKPFPQSGDNFTTIAPINSLFDLEAFIAMQDIEDIDKALRAFNKTVPVSNLEASHD